MGIDEKTKTRFDEDFTRVTMVGNGMSGEVLRAHSRMTGLDYAVKVKKNRARGTKAWYVKRGLRAWTPDVTTRFCNNA